MLLLGMSLCLCKHWLGEGSWLVVDTIGVVEGFVIGYIIAIHLVAPAFRERMN